MDKIKLQNKKNVKKIHVERDGAVGQGVDAHVGERIRLDGPEQRPLDADVVQFGRHLRSGHVVQLGRRQRRPFDLNGQLGQSGQSGQQLRHRRTGRHRLQFQLAQLDQRVEGVRLDRLQDGQRTDVQRLQPTQLGETVASDRADRIAGQVQRLEQRRRRPQEGRDGDEAVARQVQVAQPIQSDDVVRMRMLLRLRLRLAMGRRRRQ